MKTTNLKLFKKKLLVLNLALILLFSASICKAQNIWNQKSLFPSTTRVGSFSFTLNGKGYVGTGINFTTLAVQDFWQYDDLTDTWTQKANFPVALYSASSFVINDTAYVTCGWLNTTGNSVNIHTYYYDLANDAWVQVADYPGTPIYNGIGLSIKGKGYVGIGYKPYNNELWQYNPDSDVWIQKANFPGSMRSTCVNFSIEDKGYVGGGAYEPTLTAFDDFYEYNPDSDSWTQLPNLPGGGRYAASSFVLGEDQDAYIACGYNYSNYLNDVWRFDTFGYTWVKVADYGGLARASAAEFALFNKAYIGLGAEANYQTDFWEFVPTGPNLLIGNLYSDDNNNQMLDTAEAPMKNILVEVNPGNMIFSSDNAGLFKGFGNSGTYTVTIPNPPNYYTMIPSSNTVSFTGFGFVDSTSNFAFVPTANVQDLRISLTPLTGPKPGFQHFYNIGYKNVGTNTMSGNVQLIFDNLLSYTGSIPNDSTINVNNDTLTFSFADLKPNQSHVIMLIFDVSTSAMIGDTIVATATINPVVGDSASVDNTESKYQPVVSSFDPNDIAVEPSGSITPQQVSNGQWLTYTIRFQNTGTASAKNIWLTDTIDQNLNLSTVEILSASHNYSLSLNGDRTLRFSFNNINLPDSNANEALSHGFIKYRIKPISTLTVGSSIANQSSIFFDFNAAVITNTVVTQVLNFSGVTENIPSTQKFLYPNPANELLIVGANKSNELQQLLIFNMEGMLIKSINLNEGVNYISINELSSGMYLCKFKSEKEIKFQKLVVQH